MDLTRSVMKPVGLTSSNELKPKFNGIEFNGPGLEPPAFRDGRQPAKNANVPKRRLDSMA